MNAGQNAADVDLELSPSDGSAQIYPNLPPPESADSTPLPSADPVRDLTSTNEDEAAARDFFETQQRHPYLPHKSDSVNPDDINLQNAPLRNANSHSYPQSNVIKPSSEELPHIVAFNEDLQQEIVASRHELGDKLGETLADVTHNPEESDLLHVGNVGTSEPTQGRIQEERALLNGALNHELGDPALSSPPSHSAGSEVLILRDVRWWLYLAEIFGRWGDRMWTFTAALFLLELFPGTLLLPAIYGFITGICVILMGSVIGEWVDATPRLKAIQVALVTQNSSVALGSLVLTFALAFRENLDTSAKVLCVFGFLIFAVVGDCASVAMHIIVEKDWVVVIADGQKKHLADMNATIRRIDLTCQILSPIIIAQIMTFSEHYIGTIVVSAWNILSMFVEYYVLLKIYRCVPRLAFKSLASQPNEQIKRKPLTRKVFKSCFSIADGWRAYFRTRVWAAGLGLAFLYMTVLSFGGVTNTYVRTQGLSESIISISMAFGAAVGIAGTFAFPKVREKVGLERTGLFALGAQLACLTFCVLSIWLPGSPFDPSFMEATTNQTAFELAEGRRNITGIDEKKWITTPLKKLPSVAVFLFGMVAARFGLWMADLTITQLIQENVPERERGVIGGVQNSFNRFMDMFKFILVICLPYPETFGILIMISFIFVISGDCFYGYYSYKTRGHLLPHCGPAPVNHEPHSLHLQIVSCHP